MKCLLRTTTALVGVAVTAGPAAAAEPIRLAVGGFFREAYMVNFDDDGEGELGNERNTDGFFNDAEIFFMGMTTLDNGLSVGARVELEGEDNEGDQIDEAWIHFSGGFGEVRIGSTDEALVGACILPPGGTDNFSAFSPNQWAANVSPFAPGFPALTSNAVCIGVDDRRGCAEDRLHDAGVRRLPAARCPIRRTAAMNGTATAWGRISACRPTPIWNRATMSRSMGPTS